MALPTVTGYAGGISTAALTNATDVAGILTVSALSAAHVFGSVTMTFGYAYATAPIIVFTPRSSLTSSSILNIWVTSTTTTFTISTNDADLISLYYQIIETQ